MGMGTTALYETDSVIEGGMWMSLSDGGLELVIGSERVFDLDLDLDGAFDRL